MYRVNDNDNRMLRERIEINFEKQYASTHYTVYTFENHTVSNAYIVYTICTHKRTECLRNLQKRKLDKNDTNDIDEKRCN